MAEKPKAELGVSENLYLFDINGKINSLFNLIVSRPQISFAYLSSSIQARFKFFLNFQNHPYEFLQTYWAIKQHFP